MNETITLKRFADLNLDYKFFDTLTKDYHGLMYCFKRNQRTTAKAYEKYTDNNLQVFTFKDENGALMNYKFGMKKYIQDSLLNILFLFCLILSSCVNNQYNEKDEHNNVDNTTTIFVRSDYTPITPLDSKMLKLSLNELIEINDSIESVKKMAALKNGTYYFHDGSIWTGDGIVEDTYITTIDKYGNIKSVSNPEYKKNVERIISAKKQGKPYYLEGAIIIGNNIVKNAVGTRNDNNIKQIEDTTKLAKAYCIDHYRQFRVLNEDRVSKVMDEKYKRSLREREEEEKKREREHQKIWQDYLGTE